MLFKLTELLHKAFTGRLPLPALRLSAALLLAVLIHVNACAYTIVMRSGRRIEIPSNFIVTSQTLTYEAAPGINITLMMTGIDVAATERANNEPQGSLLQRATVATPSATAAKGSANASTQARRTLTNKDLEASQRARQQSEAAYERRRIELGLPSLDEVRRRNAAEAERAREQLQQSARDEEQAEGYWRERANALRSEMVALDAEINYLRAQLAAESDFIPTPYTSVTTVVPSFPFGRQRQPFPRSFPQPFPQPVLTGNPGFIHATTPGLQIAGRIGFGGGQSRSRVFFNGGAGVPLVAPPVIVGSTVFGSPLATYSTGPLPYDYYPSYERAAIIARLREIEATRAGLQARWRLLEDEARRAGALPGWLRP
jgi:hypothetical protein